MDTSEAGSEYPTAVHSADGGGFIAWAWELPQADIFSIVLGLTFVLLGVIAISAYGVVRAIEWFSRSCPDEWWQAREVR